MDLLVMFFKEHEEKMMLPLKEGEDPSFVVARVMVSRGMAKDNLKYSFVLKSQSILPEFYLGCLRIHNDKLIFDTSYIVEANFAFWIPERRKILEGLDVEFLRAIEGDNIARKNEIVLQKKFLRDLPNFVLRKFAEQMPLDSSDPGRIPYHQVPGVVDSFDVLTPSQQTKYRQLFNMMYSREQALRYTPFHNVLRIDVEDPGSGYQTPPSLKFEGNNDMAFPPEYECVLENGGVKEVKILTAGSGYIGGVKITASEPNGLDGRQAILTAKIFHEVVPNYPLFE